MIEEFPPISSILSPTGTMAQATERESSMYEANRHQQLNSTDVWSTDVSSTPTMTIHRAGLTSPRPHDLSNRTRKGGRKKGRIEAHAVEPPGIAAPSSNMIPIVHSPVAAPGWNISQGSMLSGLMPMNSDTSGRGSSPTPPSPAESPPPGDRRHNIHRQTPAPSSWSSTRSPRERLPARHLENTNPFRGTGVSRSDRHSIPREPDPAAIVLSASYQRSLSPIPSLDAPTSLDRLDHDPAVEARRRSPSLPPRSLERGLPGDATASSHNSFQQTEHRRSPNASLKTSSTAYSDDAPSISEKWDNNESQHMPRPVAERVVSFIAASLPKHPQFYINDEMLTFNVEGCLFRTHRYFLQRDSEDFRALFATMGDRGRTDDTAIVLNDVARREFECLLQFMYSGMYEPYMPHWRQEEWCHLLAISTRFSFHKMRDQAIRVIESFNPPLDPVERIVLAETYDVDHWLAPAYVDLCQRNAPLTIPETERLGIHTTTRLAQVREAVLLELIAECRMEHHKRDNTVDIEGESMINSFQRSSSKVSKIVAEIFWPSS